MELAGYEFDDVVTDVTEVSDDRFGVFVVLCLVEDEPHCVLDVGTSEGAKAVTAIPTGNLQYHLKTHQRRDCWEANVHGEIGYCLMYLESAEERLTVEGELLWKFDHACGPNPWDRIEESWQRYKRQEEEFGPRGSFEI